MVVAVYLVSMVLYGHYRGFVRLAVSAVSLVLSLGVVHLVRRLSRIRFAAMRWSIRRWRTA
ncbi:MAG: hypothetical protein ACLR8P_05595 [Clostridium fessum]